MKKNNPVPPAQCPVCGNTIKHVPAGMSKKTGKPYMEFWSCINYDCNYTWRPPSKRELEHEEVMDALRKIYKAVKESK